MFVVALVASMFMMNGCDSSDLPDGAQEELLSLLYPEIFDAIKGEDGDSAYQVAVNEGYEGTVDEWLQSLVGAQGEAGEDGVCPDCNVTDPEPEPVPVEECLVTKPPEVEDDLVHIVVWYTREDLFEPTFEHYLIIDGFPVLRSTVYPGADENHTEEDMNGTTVLMGQYMLEENATAVHAVGVQFNQLEPEPEAEPEAEPEEV